MPASRSASLSPAEHATLLGIARRAIARRLALASVPEGPDPPTLAVGPLGRAAAVFVTLKLDHPSPEYPGGLRGCIGTLEASMPLAQAVAYYAERAAFDDPRFPPLDAAELDRLTIHVSVLSPRRPLRAPAEIRLGRDGVILERGAARSVFLPQVAVEQGWDVGRLLEQLARKAGLEPASWRDAELFAFEAEAFGESTRDQGAGG